MTDGSRHDSREILARAWAWHTWQPRWLPGHVQGAIRRLALAQVRRNGLVECRLDSGQRFLVDPAEVIQCHIGTRGEWEGDIYKALRPLVQEGDTVLDVGAHVGYSTVVFSDWVGAGGKVYSFEPFPAHVERIRANLVMNDLESRVEIVAAAVSDTDGLVDLYLPESLNSGVGSLSKPNRRTRSVTVQALRLDDFIRSHGMASVALCKLDIEGAEGRALAGMRDSLAAHIVKDFLVELHPEELRTLGDTPEGVLQTLRENGYAISYWDSSGKFTEEKSEGAYAYVLATLRQRFDARGV
jgi:FkbM family methyltransferase